MTTRRTTGPQAHAVKSALAPPGDATLPLYSEIFSGLPGGVVVLHLESPKDVRSFRIMDLNPAAALLTGSTLEGLRGRTLAEFPRLLKTAFPNECLDALHARKSKNLGEISCSDERIRQGIYSGQVFSWNSGAERLKGYCAEEILGKHFSVFYPPEDVTNGKPEQILAMATERGQSEDEGWRIRKDGSRFWANVVVTALRNAKGSLQGFAKVTRDMTDRHGKEEALEKAKELLEVRFKQRTDVLAQVNHELRTEIAERKGTEEQFKASLEQLRALAARLQSVREEERTSIAREIHDELGQS